MVKIRAALFGLMLAVAMAPGGAVLARTPLPALETNAQTLATIVLPREPFLAIRVPRFDAAYAEELESDEAIIKLEKTHPGITKAVAAAGSDEARKCYDAALTLLQNDVAKLYASNFTVAELGTMITFFAGETGQAMIAMSAGSSGDTASEMETSRRAKAMAFLQNPSETTKRDLTALMESGLLPKIRAINPQIAALSAQRFDDVSTMVEAALPARVEAAIKAFTEKPKP